jgi:hypothetical protein
MNPHHIPARKFLLKMGNQIYGTYCWSTDLLVDCGNGGTIVISAHCNTNVKSYDSGFGHSNGSSENDPDFNGSTFFTGESNYTVKELKIFDLIDSRTNLRCLVVFIVTSAFRASFGRGTEWMMLRTLNGMSRQCETGENSKCEMLKDCSKVKNELEGKLRHNTHSQPRWEISIESLGPLRLGQEN